MLGKFALGGRQEEEAEEGGCVWFDDENGTIFRGSKFKESDGRIKAREKEKCRNPEGGRTPVTSSAGPSLLAPPQNAHQSNNHLIEQIKMWRPLSPPRKRDPYVLRI